MQRILLFGSGGQVGRYLRQSLELDYALITYARDQLDLTQTDSVAEAIVREKPDLVINASAYTAVDKAESEPDLAFVINSDVPRQMALGCAEINIPFIHYSTDYVFSGAALKPYREDDETSPQSIYGSSKLAGEQAVMDVLANRSGQTGFAAYIFRTSWVYSQQGNNFYKTMLRLAGERDELAIVADQFGAPTYAGSISRATLDVVKQLFAGRAGESGVYHMSCSGKTSWFEFAKAIFALHGINHLSVKPLTTADYPTPAKRPAFSVLDNARLQQVFGVQMPDWGDALQQCVEEGSV